MNCKRCFTRLLLGLFPLLGVLLASGPASAGNDPTPTVALQCGSALTQWNTAATADLSLRVVAVRPATSPSTPTSADAGVVLVKLALENERDEPLALKANQFILTDCLNGRGVALSCALGSIVQPLQFAPLSDERATAVARAKAAACQTLPMLTDHSVPAHGQLQGWVAFPSWNGAQPRMLEFLIFSAGTHIQSTIRCSLVSDLSTAATPSASTESDPCARTPAPATASPAAS